MIGKATRGGSARGLGAYLQGPGRRNEHTRANGESGGEVIGGNIAYAMPGETDPRGWSRTMDRITSRRPDIKNPIVHVSLSIPAVDGRLSDGQWNDIAHDLIDELGCEPDQPFVVVRHGVSENGNDHIHVVISRVGFDRHIWQARQDWRRIHGLCRKEEIKYGLTRVENPREARKHPKSSRSAATVAEREMRAKGVRPFKDEMRDAIDRGITQTGRAAGSDRDDAGLLEEFSDRLEAQGIHAEPTGTDIVYSRITTDPDTGAETHDHHISGTRLGAAYTRTGVLDRIRSLIDRIRGLIHDAITADPQETGRDATGDDDPKAAAMREQLERAQADLRRAREELAAARESVVKPDEWTSTVARHIDPVLAMIEASGHAGILRRGRMRRELEAAAADHSEGLRRDAPWLPRERTAIPTDLNGARRLRMAVSKAAYDRHLGPYRERVRAAQERLDALTAGRKPAKKTTKQELVADIRRRGERIAQAQRDDEHARRGDRARGAR